MDRHRDSQDDETDPLPPGTVVTGERPPGLATLAVDIGGTRLKAGLMSVAGAFIGQEPVRTNTPKPASPETVIAALEELVKPLGAFDRVSVGFPGVVRHSVVLTAPNLGTVAWQGVTLGATLAEKWGKPVRVLNDASVQGLGVIGGKGLEVVITLGTGMGFAVFNDGRLMPHFELSQHPVRKDTTYDQYIGVAALKSIGEKRWNKRVEKAIGWIDTLTTFDTLYVGGGNAKHITFNLPLKVQTVSNQAGITGGVRLWDALLDDEFPK